MTHKKKEHIENVSICWNFSDGSCPFEDDSCWFKHVTEPNEKNSESGQKSIKCNMCGKIINNRNNFMRHRKDDHEEMLQMCKLFENGNCTYKDKCLFSHTPKN